MTQEEIPSLEKRNFQNVSSLEFILIKKSLMSTYFKQLRKFLMATAYKLKSKVCYLNCGRELNIMRARVTRISTKSSMLALV